jgi:ubiquinone/menaquinone biosynthesis C-methylase UbiE
MANNKEGIEGTIEGTFGRRLGKDSFLPIKLREGHEKKLTPYEMLWRENFSGKEIPASLNLATEFIDLLNPGEDVVDIGCGFGRVANLLSIKKDVTVVGVDINESAIEEAREHTTKINENTLFDVGNGADLIFSDNQFDAAILVGVVGGVELEERQVMLSEAYRVLKPGGKIAIAEYELNDANPKKREKYEAGYRETKEWGGKIIRIKDGEGEKILYVKHFAPIELELLLKQAGFISIQVKEDEVKSKGLGDGIEETRKQLTAWGFKSKKNGKRNGVNSL